MKRVEISKRLVLINFLSSAFTHLLTITVLVWLQQYLVKRISVEEYSILPVVYAVMAFTPLLTVVLKGGLGKFVTAAYARGDDEEVTRICSSMFPILLAAGLLFLTGGWTFAWNIGHVMTIPQDRLWDARLMMALLILTAALRLPAAPFVVGFFVRQKFMLLNFITIGCTLFRIGLLFALLFGVSTRVLWVTVATAAMEFLLLAITLPISMRLVPALRFRRSAVRASQYKEVFSFSGWQLLIVAGVTIRNALDPIVLNKLSTATDLACYNLAAIPFQHLWTLISSARRSLNPSLIAMHALEAEERLRAAFLRGNRYALWGFLLPGVPLAVLAHPLMELYAPPHLWLTGAVLQINFFAFLMLVPSFVFFSIAEAMGRQGRVAILLLSSNVFNLLLTLFFVGVLDMGVIGSSSASAVASAIFYPLLIWPLARRILNTPQRVWMMEVLLPGILPAVCAAPAYLVADWYFDASTPAGAIASLAIGSVVYVVSLYVFAARKQDKADLKRGIRSARKRVGL